MCTCSIFCIVVEWVLRIIPPDGPKGLQSDWFCMVEAMYQWLGIGGSLIEMHRGKSYSRNVTYSLQWIICSAVQRLKISWTMYGTSFARCFRYRITVLQCIVMYFLTICIIISVFYFSLFSIWDIGTNFYLLHRPMVNSTIFSLYINIIK